MFLQIGSRDGISLQSIRLRNGMFRLCYPRRTESIAVRPLKHSHNTVTWRFLINNLSDVLFHYEAEVRFLFSCSLSVYLKCLEVN